VQSQNSLLGYLQEIEQLGFGNFHYISNIVKIFALMLDPIRIYRNFGIILPNAKGILGIVNSWLRIVNR
jgi:hypothetical protein